MRTFSGALCFYACILSPLISGATVELPPYECVYTGEEHAGRVTCSMPIYNLSHGFIVSGQKPSTPDEFKAAKYKELREKKLMNTFYTKEEIDNASLKEDEKIGALRKELSDELKNVRALVPSQIGEAVNKSIKENLGATLQFLLQQDPEFRKLLAELLKRQ